LSFALPQVVSCGTACFSAASKRRFGASKTVERCIVAEWSRGLRPQRRNIMGNVFLIVFVLFVAYKVFTGGG
jgi:hypothetical protein